jgi:hypothetical protein
LLHKMTIKTFALGSVLSLVLAWISLCGQPAFALTLLNNTGVTVDEGATGKLIGNDLLLTTDEEDVAAFITYTLDVVPIHGILRKGGTALNAGGTFTQQDIDNGDISYDHDGSESPTDSFYFTVRDWNCRHQCQ